MLLPEINNSVMQWRAENGTRRPTCKSFFNVSCFGDTHAGGGLYSEAESRKQHNSASQYIIC